jgi:hypothetical protein
MPFANELYLTVLPLVHFSKFFAGEHIEEVMTLVPDRNFATEFFADEVDNYIRTFEAAANEKFTGGHVKSYKFEKKTTEEGRIYVVVTQNVA